MASPISAPDPGQLVEVRRRRYVVMDVAASVLPADPLRPAAAAQHLVSLSSIEDDALGEEIQVIWEIEPGAQVRDASELPGPTGPDDFDDPARLDAFLDAVRWGAVSSADVTAIQAPFRSGIDIEDYQLEPLVRALQMPRVNLLIADDVGLGKTIEAGLVLQELILRHRVRSVLVVCPASLQIQWRDQMRDKFGVPFRIVDAELMRTLRRSRGLQVNPWRHYPRLITSIDFLKRDRPLRLLRETLPPEGKPSYPRQLDLLIVDEAHNVAPSGTGRYATDSLRTAAIRTLAPHCEHKLFLTATPHNGYQESFSALLELLDNQRFARTLRPDPAQLRTVMVRRMKSELDPLWDGTPRFPERVIEPLEVPYTAAERRAHAALAEYSRSRHERAPGDDERFVTEFVLKLLKKRLFSSPAAFATTLGKHLRSLQSGSSRRRTSRPKPPTSILKRRIADIEEEFSDDAEYEDAAGQAVDEASQLLPELTASERALLDELDRYASSAAPRPDSKAETLLRWLQETLRPKGVWSRRRALIFTEYRATQKWLQEILASAGLTRGDRLLTLYGGMDPEERERVKAAFQANPDESPVRILLATDAASEGIDLQNHCSLLVHYEIPWNPNRMEQRNGRLDRHGQRAPKVLVHHFVGKGFGAAAATAIPGDLEGDLEFLLRVARKIETIREDLGKVGPVIAAQVEEAMLGKRKTLDTARAEEEAAPIRGMLTFERKLKEQIAKLAERLYQSRQELHVSPESVGAVVKIGLSLARQPPLRDATLPGIWPDATGHRRSCPVFHLPPLKGSWRSCAEGIAHPHTGTIRPIVFDHALAQGREDVVLVHLNHKLVTMCQRLLRGEMWSGTAGTGRGNLHRVCARTVPDAALDAPAVVAMGRLVVLGGDNRRLHEEIVAAGGLLREGRFSRIGVGQVEAALAAQLPSPPSLAVRARLASLWPSIAPAVSQALQARMKDRTAGLEKAVRERAAKEAADMTTILRELERAIRAKIEDPELLQLPLFSDPEREQFERNKSFLAHRLAAIPDEIDREVREIRKRYADPTPRLFPIAVTFLVPERLSR